LAEFGEVDNIELYNKGTYASHPFAMVNLRSAIPEDKASPCQGLLRAGKVEVMGVLCVLKQRRPPQQHRKRETDASEASVRAAEAAVVANRPAWQPEMLERYPSRATTLCEKKLVADLDPVLTENLQLYLKQKFPGSEEVCNIMFWIAGRERTALRVKELFETVECATMIGREVSACIKSVAKQNKIKKKAAKKRARQSADGESGVGAAAAGEETPGLEEGVRVIYDLACGHGLLGCLLAYRFPQLRVVCVDLERRKGFDAFLAAFEALGEASKTPPPQIGTAESDTAAPVGVGSRVLPNLEFVEADIAEVPIEAGAFVASVHGCNEVSKVGVERAIAAGGCWATMPCCIRDGIYAVQRTSRVADEQRYACMVGVLAGTYAARFIHGIDRRITNRNLCVFGGELLQITCPKADMKRGPGSGAGERYESGGSRNHDD
jgi:hypothetical protein